MHIPSAKMQFVRAWHLRNRCRRASNTSTNRIQSRLLIYPTIPLQIKPVLKDIHRIIKNDSRVLSKLHKRIFMDKITTEHVTIYLSFYVEASNRDQFMGIKQDFMLAFVDCIERNDAKLATKRMVVSSGCDCTCIHALCAACSMEPGCAVVLSAAGRHS